MLAVDTPAIREALELLADIEWIAIREKGDNWPEPRPAAREELYTCPACRSELYATAGRRAAAVPGSHRPDCELVRVRNLLTENR